MKKSIIPLRLFLLLLVLGYSSLCNSFRYQDFEILDNRIYKYYGHSADVTIPSKVIDDHYGIGEPEEVTVVEIGKEAFRYHTEIINVTIPNTIESIGSGAFSDCSNLQNINIPNSVKTIGSSAFKNCISLVNIYLPNTLEAITSNLFHGCTKLEQIKIPETVISIGSFAFRKCTSLKEMVLPNSVQYIYDGAFADCTSLSYVSIPNSIKRMSWDQFYVHAFSGCSSLKSVFIDAEIVKTWFAGMKSLESVVLGNNVKKIDGHAFNKCRNLKDVHISNSVNKIDQWAFQDCTSLVEINIPNSIDTIDSYVFIGCESLTHLSIPSSVRSIGKSAFEDCTGLQSIIIPNSVHSIGEWAFADCKSLKHVKLPSKLDIIENFLFNGCWSLTSITIPNFVKTIGEYAFCETGLRAVNIPNSVKKIGDGAFSYCPLTTVTIPESVESIDGNAFFYCIYLRNYYCHVKEPLSESGLLKNPKDLIVYVPYESYDLYRNHNEWSKHILSPQMTLKPKIGFDVEGNWDPSINAIGVTADGKSEIYISQFLDLLPEGTSLEDIELKIYLDEEECSDEKITGKYSKIGLSNDNPGKWGFSYTAPEDFPESIKENEYTLDFYFVSNVKGLETLISAAQIKVMRPGVMLVHGLNSNASCFANLEKNLSSEGGYKNYQISNVNYSNSNKARFNNNTYKEGYEVIKNNAKKLFRQLADNGIVSSGYDMIGHSMGGILIRKYAQEVDKKSVNKIITVNTPHSGSPWADAYIEMVSRLDEKVSDMGAVGGFGVLTHLYAAYKKEYGNWGAIQDLSPSSSAIADLNNPDYIVKVQDIPVQALYSTLNMDKAVPQKVISIDSKYSWLYDPFTTGTFFARDKDGKINDVEILNRLFGKEKHDGVVPLNSQCGGLMGIDLSPKGDEYKGAFGFSSYSHHCNITDNSGTFSKIHELLYSPKDSDCFEMGFKPLDLSRNSSRSRAVEEIVDFKEPSESQFIKIQAEHEDTARVLKVMVSGSDDLWANLVFISLDEDNLLTGIGQNEYRFRIPDTYEGDLTVYALGRTDDDALVGDSVVVHYEKAASLKYLFFEDWPSVTMVEGQQLELNVIGGWSNGEENYVSPVYSTDKEGIIGYDGSLITAEAEGECLLIANYEGLADTITVKVLAATANSIRAVEMDKPSIKYSSGSLVVTLDNGYTGPISVMIYDLSGNICYQQHRNVSVQAMEPIAIDLSVLPSQLFIAKVRASNEHTIKFVKK